ncbi:hypothetical protein AN216_07465 [Streptomyces oceani]|uniref:Uncharacterized protein n=1 Tax=Streptomyces oceani TaxID=1075402 RepID=A0A1E7KK13_9ACTN|nr:hypothetical protein AN216_07465 [Streptomyces oceani]
MGEAADAGTDGTEGRDGTDGTDGTDGRDGEDPADPEATPDGGPERVPRPGMTPRQARRIRVVTSGVVMAAVAAALVIRLGNAPSLLVVGLYGIALILSGIAIVLSRRGRTRVATAVLGCGFVMVILAERMLPDGS